MFSPKSFPVVSGNGYENQSSEVHNKLFSRSPVPPSSMKPEQIYVWIQCKAQLDPKQSEAMESALLGRAPALPEPTREGETQRQRCPIFAINHAEHL